MSNLNNQKGSIIIFAISVLALLTSIAIGIVPLFISRYRASLESSSSTTAIYAADSGIEWCLYVNREGPNPPPKPLMNTGANLEIYNASNNIAACTTAESPLNHRAVGTFRGVSRSFRIFYP